MGKAADLLLQVWNDPNRKLGSLPDDFRPGNLAHAYRIQQAVSRGLGAIGGWTISRSEALDSLVCAPLPLASIHLSPTCLASGHWTYRRLVPRICFRLGACLPDYDAPYSDDRIIAAIESCHVAIEVRQPRFADAHALDALTALADSNGYRCLVYSRQGLSWQSTAPLHGEGRIIVESRDDSGRDNGNRPGDARGAALVGQSCVALGRRTDGRSSGHGRGWNPGDRRAGGCAGSGHG